MTTTVELRRRSRLPLRLLLLHLRGSLDLLLSSTVVVIGSLKIRYVHKWGCGLLPVDIAFAILIDHVLEDLTKSSTSLSLLCEICNFVLVPGSTHIAGVTIE